MTGITATLTPVRARFVRSSTGSSTLATTSGSNKSSTNSEVTVDLQKTVENTMTSTWSNETSFTTSVGMELSMELVSFSGSVSKTVTVGTSESFSDARTVGSSQGVSAQLEPNQSVYISLLANTGTLSVRVEYDVSLSGSMLVYKKGGNEGKHRKTSDIADILRAAGVENKFTLTQEVTVGMFSDGYFEIKDAESGKSVTSQ